MWQALEQKGAGEGEHPPLRYWLDQKGLLPPGIKGSLSHPHTSLPSPPPRPPLSPVLLPPCPCGCLPAARADGREKFRHPSLQFFHGFATQDSQTHTVGGVVLLVQGQQLRPHIRGRVCLPGLI